MAGFDADFFGISPREAEAMDPQQRLMLEVAYEALEHAGIATEDLSGVRAAVMMGVYYGEYQTISAANPDAIDAYSATGNAHAVAVGRIAYLLGLRGPAVAIDSACSSSLVTIHLACQSLRLRESDLALAGGVSLILRPETQIAMAKWGMLSPQRPVPLLRLPAPTGSSAAKAAASWCSSGSPTRCATATGCWRSCGARRSTRTAAPTA